MSLLLFALVALGIISLIISGLFISKSFTKWEIGIRNSFRSNKIQITEEAISRERSIGILFFVIGLEAVLYVLYYNFIVY